MSEDSAIVSVIFSHYIVILQENLNPLLFIQALTLGLHPDLREFVAFCLGPS